MVVYLYKWKVESHQEQKFQEAWSYITEQLREKCGSLGSRLHYGSDGYWYGYAQWPSVEHRSQKIGVLKHREMEAARKMLSENAIELPEVLLNIKSDFLLRD